MIVFRPSLRSMLILAFIVVTVTPVAVMTLWLNSDIHRVVMKEAHDKNQLLSENLANPIYLYLRAAQSNLRLLANLLDKTKDHATVIETIASQTYFKNIVLIYPDGSAHNFDGHKVSSACIEFFKTNPVIRSLIARHTEGNSGMVEQPSTKSPALYFLRPAGKIMLIAEVKTEPIQELAGNIHFGKLGHCAITDQFGNIVHHPNPEWMSSIKNISSWPIVKAGLEGKQGVMTFYSPFIKADMIAGYASVPEFNWVVLTPQPLSELTANAQTMTLRNVLVGSFASIFAVILAVYFANWITRPINTLEEGVERVRKNDYTGNFKPLGMIAPKEIEALRDHSIHMVESIRAAAIEKDKLNYQLEEKINQATLELTEANKKLSKLAHLDELTSLKNRRALEERLSTFNRSDPATYLPIQAMLFDVDKFKQINDTYGHDAGDLVLERVAREIENHTREMDLVVRYGGDEFLVIMPCCTSENAYRRAEAISAAISTAPPVVHGQTIEVTMSIGIADQTSPEVTTEFSAMLKAADKAMYQSKQSGRNKISVSEIPGLKKS